MMKEMREKKQREERAHARKMKRKRKFLKKLNMMISENIAEQLGYQEEAHQYTQQIFKYLNFKIDNVSNIVVNQNDQIGTLAELVTGLSKMIKGESLVAQPGAESDRLKLLLTEEANFIATKLPQEQENRKYFSSKTQKNI